MAPVQKSVEPAHPRWSSYQVVVFNGQHDTHIKTGEDYETRTLASLFGIEPADRPKAAGFAFIPSTYRDHDAREHKAQRDRGQFVTLTGDIDKGDQPLERIEELVRSFAGDAAWLIYSSAHAQTGDMRWRVIIPLDAPASFATWHDAQHAFFDFMEAAGVAMDRALGRAAQPVYLPNVPASHARTGTRLRGADGAPLYYRSRSTGAEIPGLRLDTGAVAAGISEIGRRRADDEREREEIRIEAERRHANRPRTENTAIIDNFNSETSITTLLELYGYQQCPRRQEDWRSPLQTGETFATRVIGNKWISLSASDAGAGVGNKCASGCYGDAYDLYVYYEHRGDHKSAFRQLHRERGDNRSPQPAIAAPSRQMDGNAAIEQRGETASEVISLADRRNGSPAWQAPDMSILTGGRTAPPPIPTDMFGPLWPLVSDLAEGAGAPVDYVAVSILAVAASLVGAKRRARPYPTSDWSEPCILWVAPVGDPSSNKSPAIDAATGLLRGLEAEYAEGHKGALSRHEAKAERAKAERARWAKDVETATKENLATPPMPEAAETPDEPSRRRLLVQDATPEAVGEILAGNPNGTLHLRDELAGWLMSFERYSPGGREFWLEAYGGRPHVIDRKSLKKPLTIPFNGVTVLGGIQPEKLSDCLLNVADDGLVARFLWAWPDPIRYRRPRQLADTGRLESLYRRLDGLEGSVDADGRNKPVVLMLTEGAAEIFEAWAAENGEAVQEAAALYKGFCGKLRGTVLRLALVCELIAWADSEGPEPDTIGADTITAAITFVEDYAKPSALRVFGDAALPESDRNAAQLARHIRKHGLPRINGRDVRREYGIASLKTSEKVDDAIESLTEAGWLRAAPSRAGGNAGRQSKDFIVNPQVHEVAHG